MLTETAVGASVADSARRACAHACSSTQRPMGTIIPVSSATSMKSTGITRPRVGCAQRSRASSLTGRAARELELPLEHDAQLVLRDRLAQRALGEEPGDGLRVHRLVEQLPPRAAATLGAVHRRVGVAQES